MMMTSKKELTLLQTALDRDYWREEYRRVERERDEARKLAERYRDEYDEYVWINPCETEKLPWEEIEK